MVAFQYPLHGSVAKVAYTIEEEEGFVG